MIVTLPGRRTQFDLDRAYDLSLGPDRAGLGPRHFGAPPAAYQSWHNGAFVGAIDQGGSCNCSVLTLIPHCHGTHTECVGHLTREPMDAIDVIPTEFLAALLISVRATAARDTQETTAPRPLAEDCMITARSLTDATGPTVVAAAMDSARGVATTPAAPATRALIIRSLPNDSRKRARVYAEQPAPFLTREAAQWLVERGIEHLVVDLPTIDRAHDEGRMTAHRLFFGLPDGDERLSAATRRTCTVTELAFVPNELRDGRGLLLLQAPRLPGDAVPSRPMFYPLVSD